MSENKKFVNPIDKDKITEKPSTLPYAHSIGGFVIKPIDKGRTKSLALEAMQKQTNAQLSQIKEQIDLLANQAKRIQKRIEISHIIYSAEIGFKPLIGKIYHLYQKNDQSSVLSVVGPQEWGRNGYPYQNFIATVELLSDHTWDIID